MRDGRTADKNEVGLLMATGGRERPTRPVMAADRRGPGAQHERAPQLAPGAILALPLISIVLSVLVGSLVIIFVRSGSSPAKLSPGLAARRLQRARSRARSGPSEPSSTRSINTTPLLLGGLAVGLGFKAGLFNIGVQGQFLMGALGSVIVGVQLAGQPAARRRSRSPCSRAWSAGAAWGFIPGFLKAVSGAHEVVTTIMLNYVAIAILAAAGQRTAQRRRLAVADHLRRRQRGAADHPRPERHIAHHLRAVMAVLYGWLLFRTTRGFEIRIAGREPGRGALRRHAPAA